MLQDVAQHCSPELKSKISRSLPAVNKTRSRIRAGRGGSRSHQGEVGFSDGKSALRPVPKKLLLMPEASKFPVFPGLGPAQSCRPEVFSGCPWRVPFIIFLGSRNIRTEAGWPPCLLLWKRGGTLSPTYPLSVDLTANLKEINTPWRAVALGAGRRAALRRLSGADFSTSGGEMSATLTFKV